MTKLFLFLLSLTFLVSSAEIIVTDSTTLYKTDSIQRCEDSLYKIVYSDRLYKKMKNGEVSDQITYLKTLLMGKYRDTSSVLGCANILFNIAAMEYYKLWLIMDTQEDNARVAVNMQRIKVKNEIGHLNDYIESITPKTETPQIVVEKARNIYK